MLSCYFLRKSSKLLSLYQSWNVTGRLLSLIKSQLNWQNNSQSYSIDDFNQSNPAGAAISKRYQLLLILYSMMPVWVLNKKLYPKNDDFYFNLVAVICKFFRLWPFLCEVFLEVAFFRIDFVLTKSVKVFIPIWTAKHSITCIQSNGM